MQESMDADDPPVSWVQVPRSILRPEVEQGKGDPSNRLVVYHEMNTGCNCKKCRCLKLYCECFAGGNYCAGCNCSNCSNNEASEPARQEAVESRLKQKSKAFRAKIQPRAKMESVHAGLAAARAADGGGGGSSGFGSGAQQKHGDTPDHDQIQQLFNASWQMQDSEYSTVSMQDSLTGDGEPPPSEERLRSTNGESFLPAREVNAVCRNSESSPICAGSRAEQLAIESLMRRSVNEDAGTPNRSKEAGFAPDSGRAQPQRCKFEIRSITNPLRSATGMRWYGCHRVMPAAGPWSGGNVIEIQLSRNDIMKLARQGYDRLATWAEMKAEKAAADGATPASAVASAAAASSASRGSAQFSFSSTNYRQVAAECIFTFQPASLSDSTAMTMFASASAAADGDGDGDGDDEALRTVAADVCGYTDPCRFGFFVVVPACPWPAPARAGGGGGRGAGDLIGCTQLASVQVKAWVYPSDTAAAGAGAGAGGPPACLQPLLVVDQTIDGGYLYLDAEPQVALGSTQEAEQRQREGEQRRREGGKRRREGVKRRRNAARQAEEQRTEAGVIEAQKCRPVDAELFPTFSKYGRRVSPVCVSDQLPLPSAADARNVVLRVPHRLWIENPGEAKEDLRLFTGRRRKDSHELEWRLVPALAWELHGDAVHVFVQKAAQDGFINEPASADVGKETNGENGAVAAGDKASGGKSFLGSLIDGAGKVATSFWALVTSTKRVPQEVWVHLYGQPKELDPTERFLRTRVVVSLDRELSSAEQAELANVPYLHEPPQRLPVHVQDDSSVKLHIEFDSHSSQGMSLCSSDDAKIVLDVPLFDKSGMQSVSVMLEWAATVSLGCFRVKQHQHGHSIDPWISASLCVEHRPHAVVMADPQGASGCGGSSNLMLVAAATTPASSSAVTSGNSRKVHFTYSREDSELLAKAKEVAREAGCIATGTLWGQGRAWFETWKKQLFEADGVIVLFTEGDTPDKPTLGNHKIGYKEKIVSKFAGDGRDAALFKEAIAIREKQAQAPNFFVYAIDGRRYTPEQLFFNLKGGAVSYGPVDKWSSFIDGLISKKAPPQSSSPSPSAGACAGSPGAAGNTSASMSTLPMSPPPQPFAKLGGKRSPPPASKPPAKRPCVAAGPKRLPSPSSSSNSSNSSTT